MPSKSIILSCCLSTSKSVYERDWSALDIYGFFFLLNVGKKKTW